MHALHHARAIVPGPMPRINGGPKPPGPVACAKAHPPASAVTAAMVPITKTFFFMAVSNSYAAEMSVAVGIGEVRFDPSFSGTGFFVTKYVRCRIRHVGKTFPRSWLAALVYIGAMQGPPHILIVDDHREIRDLVSRALTKEGFRVSAAADGRAMRKVLADGAIDLILLDLMLPGEDGLSLCRALRTKSSIPIIMLTAKGDEVDRVIGLEMGADDYLPKPFGSRELIARIKAVLRRSGDKVAPPNTDRRPKHYPLR